ncbi:hypothetical protein OC835_004881 [Tilletia horrida]|nr:hypothetical protein OC835_004881 [Tilletia horrida]
MSQPGPAALAAAPSTPISRPTTATLSTTSGGKPRIRAFAACIECNKAKVKCDGDKPNNVACTRCNAHGLQCGWAKSRRGRLPGSKNKPKNQGAQPAAAAGPAGPAGAAATGSNDQNSNSISTSTTTSNTTGSAQTPQLSQQQQQSPFQSSPISQGDQAQQSFLSNQPQPPPAKRRKTADAAHSNGTTSPFEHPSAAGHPAAFFPFPSPPAFQPQPGAQQNPARFPPSISPGTNAADSSWWQAPGTQRPLSSGGGHHPFQPQPGAHPQLHQQQQHQQHMQNGQRIGLHQPQLHQHGGPHPGPPYPSRTAPAPHTEYARFSSFGHDIGATFNPAAFHLDLNHLAAVSQAQPQHSHPSAPNPIGSSHSFPQPVAVSSSQAQQFLHPESRNPTVSSAYPGHAQPPPPPASFPTLPSNNPPSTSGSASAPLSMGPPLVGPAAHTSTTSSYPHPNRTAVILPPPPTQSTQSANGSAVSALSSAVGSRGGSTTPAPERLPSCRAAAGRASTTGPGGAGGPGPSKNLRPSSSSSSSSASASRPLELYSPSDPANPLNLLSHAALTSKQDGAGRSARNGYFGSNGARPSANSAAAAFAGPYVHRPSSAASSSSRRLTVSGSGSGPGSGSGSGYGSGSGSGGPVDGPPGIYSPADGDSPVLPPIRDPHHLLSHAGTPQGHPQHQRPSSAHSYLGGPGAFDRGVAGADERRRAEGGASGRVEDGARRREERDGAAVSSRIDSRTAPAGPQRPIPASADVVAQNHAGPEPNTNASGADQRPAHEVGGKGSAGKAPAAVPSEEEQLRMQHEKRKRTQALTLGMLDANAFEYHARGSTTGRGTGAGAGPGTGAGAGAGEASKAKAKAKAKGKAVDSDAAAATATAKHSREGGQKHHRSEHHGRRRSSGAISASSARRRSVDDGADLEAGAASALGAVLLPSSSSSSSSSSSASPHSRPASPVDSEGDAHSRSRSSSPSPSAASHTSDDLERPLSDDDMGGAGNFNASAAFTLPASPPSPSSKVQQPQKQHERRQRKRTRSGDVVDAGAGRSASRGRRPGTADSQAVADGRGVSREKDGAMARGVPASAAADEGRLRRQSSRSRARKQHGASAGGGADHEAARDGDGENGIAASRLQRDRAREHTGGSGDSSMMRGPGSGSGSVSLSSSILGAVPKKKTAEEEARALAAYRSRLMQYGWSEAHIRDAVQEREAYFKDGPVLADVDIKEVPDVLAAGVLSEDEVQDLFDFYFRELNIICAFLDPHLHTPTFVRARSNLLYTVICFIAASVDPRPSSQARVEALEKMCFAQFRVCSEANARSCEIVQASLLYNLWSLVCQSSARDLGSAFVGHAVRMALEIGLGESVRGPGSAEQQTREGRNRLRAFITAVIQDRSLSAFTGRQPVATLDECVNLDEWVDSPLAIPADVEDVGFVRLRLLEQDIRSQLAKTSTSDHHALERVRKAANDRMAAWLNHWTTKPILDQAPVTRATMKVVALHVQLVLNTVTKSACRNRKADCLRIASKLLLIVNTELQKSVQYICRTIQGMIAWAAVVVIQLTDGDVPSLAVDTALLMAGNANDPFRTRTYPRFYGRFLLATIESAHADSMLIPPDTSEGIALEPTLAVMDADADTHAASAEALTQPNGPSDADAAGGRDGAAPASHDAMSARHQQHMQSQLEQGHSISGIPPPSAAGAFPQTFHVQGQDDAANATATATMPTSGVNGSGNLDPPLMGPTDLSASHAFPDSIGDLDATAATTFGYFQSAAASSSHQEGVPVPMPTMSVPTDAHPNGDQMKDGGSASVGGVRADGFPLVPMPGLDVSGGMDLVGLDESFLLPPGVNWETFLSGNVPLQRRL